MVPLDQATKWWGVTVAEVWLGEVSGILLCPLVV